ncbi:MAG: hypothetical protein IJ695_05625 [Butyrivibrio sp.]|nr:hypothetical protein [Butyrivibrio sp.]
MFLLTISAALFVSARISVRYKKNILDTTPLCFGILILCMYVLAFFRELKILPVLSAFVILAVFVRLFLEEKSVPQAAKRAASYIKELLNPVVVTVLICSVIIGIATKDMLFTWWDDINFWASDAKQLFFLNGFPGKYGNVSPEFGDYPPLTSLFKYLFLNIRPDSYTESLQFTGYFSLYAIFLMPLLARIRDCADDLRVSAFFGWVILVVASVSVLALPGVFCGIIYYGTPADVIMAIIYGVLLLAIFEQAGHGDLFYFGRIGVYTALLFLSKSIGFEWALFALIFYMLVGRKKRAIFGSIFFAGAFYGSWLVFCLLMRRVAKLTGEGLRLAASGRFEAPDNTLQKIRYFAEGFLIQPMHSDNNPTLDISGAGIVVLLALLIFALHRAGLLGKNENRRISLFFALTLVLSYGIVFLAHISIFRAEDQYLDAFAMGISMSRYCAPFTLGMTILLLGIMFLRIRAKNVRRYFAVAGSLSLAFVLLSADYRGISDYLWRYRDDLLDDATYIEDMVGDKGRKIVLKMCDEKYWGKRVLILRDGRKYYWVHDAYISKQASPTALVYDTFIDTEETAESLREKIRKSHASYFYVEEKEGISFDAFSDLMPDGAFEPGRVYETDVILNNG